MHYNLANLLAALAILAILAVSFAPFVAETGAAVAVEQAAQQLAQELQTLRQRAVAEDSTYDVYFEWANRSYVIRGASSHAVGRRVHLPPGVEWYGPFNEKIIFYNSGRVNQAGTITLNHPHSGQRIRVIIASRTGRIRLERRVP